MVPFEKHQVKLVRLGDISGLNARPPKYKCESLLLGNQQSSLSQSGSRIVLVSLDSHIGAENWGGWGCTKWRQKGGWWGSSMYSPGYLHSGLQ
jgi:hypothetical protein